MPLELELRKKIEEYCKKDLPGDLTWHIDQFSFIDNQKLRSVE